MNFALLIRYKEYAREEIPVAIRLQKDGYFFLTRLFRWDIINIFLSLSSSRGTQTWKFSVDRYWIYGALSFKRVIFLTARTVHCTQEAHTKRIRGLEQAVGSGFAGKFFLAYYIVQDDILEENKLTPTTLFHKTIWISRDLISLVVAPINILYYPYTRCCS